MLNAARVTALVLALVAGHAVAQDTQVDSLVDAQRKLRTADEELKRAQRDVRRAEERAQAAKEAHQAAQKELEDTRLRVEKTGQDVVTAKAATAEAQRHYDSARAVIEKIYEGRQR